MFNWKVKDPPHIPEYYNCPFRLQNNQFYVIIHCILPIPAQTPNPCHLHVSTGHHQYLRFRSASPHQISHTLNTHKIVQIHNRVMRTGGPIISINCDPAELPQCTLWINACSINSLMNNELCRNKQ